MIIVIDANILFSAIITPNGKIAEILGHPSLGAARITCHFLVQELNKHVSKIIRAAKRSEESVMDDISGYLKYIQIYHETSIDLAHLKDAKHLTEGVDLYDMDYVALALQTGGYLWTGDKKLSDHLKKKGFSRVLNTSELCELFEIG